jgi:putative transposase
MSRGLTFQVGGFYHIYNRGTEGREIFTSSNDSERFTALLYHANSVEPLLHRVGRGPTSAKSLLESARGDSFIDLCVYCLMPNHFHLLVHEHTEGGVSRFMQKLSTAYTMYFNTRYERTGVLFQGKFKAREVNEDRYLKYLIAYIHLNPVKLIEPKWKEIGIRNVGRAAQFLRSYPYSSYQDYRGAIRSERKLINPNALPHYFENSKEFEASMVEWLSYKDPRSDEVGPRPKNRAFDTSRTLLKAQL